MSSSGGFTQTHDTGPLTKSEFNFSMNQFDNDTKVIAIQALANYAAFLDRDFNTEVSLETYDGHGWKRIGSPVKVTKENKMSVNIENFAVDDSVEKIRLTSNGVGSVNVQYIQHYYEESPNENSFEADVDVDENNDLRRRRDTSGQPDSKVAKFYTMY